MGEEEEGFEVASCLTEECFPFLLLSSSLLLSVVLDSYLLSDGFFDLKLSSLLLVLCLEEEEDILISC